MRKILAYMWHEIRRIYYIYVVSFLNDFSLAIRPKDSHDSFRIWKNNAQQEIIFWERWLKTAQAAQDKEYLQLRDSHTMLQDIFLMFFSKGPEVKKFLMSAQARLPVLIKYAIAPR